jgi:hypothetical protein
VHNVYSLRIRHKSGVTSPLTLAEVEVYSTLACPSAHVPTRAPTAPASAGCHNFLKAENVAVGRQTFQSSNYANGRITTNTISQLAVDGNIDGNHPNCSHTALTGPHPAWWQVNFESPTTVRMVRIYNRADCCGDKLNGAVVELLGSGGTMLSAFEIANSAPAAIEDHGYGSSVHNVYSLRIRHKSGVTSPLTLAEVEVYSTLACPH